MKLANVCLQSNAAQPTIQTKIYGAQSRREIPYNNPDGDWYPTAGRLLLDYHPRTVTAGNLLYNQAFG